MRATRFPIVLFLLFPALPSTAARILVPVVYNGPGANGSMWLTAVTATNRTNRPWSSPDIGFIVECPIPEGCASNELQPNHSSFLANPDSIFALVAPTGILLTVPDDGELISITARITAGTRWGTELPRIPERDFRETTLLLPQVPASTANYRSLIRVYALDVRETDVTVLFRESLDPSVPPAASETLHLVAPDGSVSRPAFAQLSVDLPLQGSLERLLAVEILAEPGVRFWAFATVTDNVTNAVTTITP